MCGYRKSIFDCNHTLVSGSPLVICPKQRDYLASRSSSSSSAASSPVSSPRASTMTTTTTASSGAESAPAPCDVVRTHTCATLRVARLCDACQDRKAAMDLKFADARAKIAALRRHLDAAYGDCVRHVYEAGIRPDGEPERGRRRVRSGGKGDDEDGGGDVKETDAKETKDGAEAVEAGAEEEVDEDPIAAFLRQKRAEKYSHLMMLGGF